MAWVLLVVAGLLEVAWSIGMKYTDGFTRLWPSLATGAGIVASMLSLSYAAKSLPSARRTASGWASARPARRYWA